MSVNGGDGPKPLRCREFARTCDGLPAYRLDTHLNHATRSFQRTDATGMVGIEGHGFFLVDVFACLNGGNEVEGMLVLGSTASAIAVSSSRVSSLPQNI